MEIYRSFTKKYWKYNYIRQKFCSIFNYYPLTYIKFNVNCLTNNNNNLFLDAVNSCICYELDRPSWDLDTNFSLGNCLFGSEKLTKNADPDKYKYSSYSIGFDSLSEFSLVDWSSGKYVIIFGADMSSSVHVDNKVKYILILGPTQGLDGTTLILQ